MRNIIYGIAIKELITQWHMAIGCDIQTEYDLLAIRSKILVVSAL